MLFNCFPSEILTSHDAVKRLCEALRGKEISVRSWRNYEREAGILGTQGVKRTGYAEEDAIKLSVLCWLKGQNRVATLTEEDVNTFCCSEAMKLLKEEIAVLVEQYRQCGEMKVHIGKVNPSADAILLSDLKREIDEKLGYAISRPTWVAWRKLAGIKLGARRCSESEAHKIRAIALAKKQSPCKRLTPEQVDDLSARSPSAIVDKFDQLFHQESLKVGCLGHDIPRLIKAHLGRKVDDGYIRALAKRKRDRKYRFFNSMSNAAPAFFSSRQYYSANQVAAWLALAEEWENIRIRERATHKRSPRFTLPPNKEDENYKEEKERESADVTAAIREETTERVFARKERVRAAQSPYKGMWCLFYLVLRNGDSRCEVRVATKDFKRWMKRHYYSAEFPPEILGTWWTNSLAEKEGWVKGRMAIAAQDEGSK